MPDLTERRAAHRHSPDPLHNHGYTDVCSCGVKIHRDGEEWVPDVTGPGAARKAWNEWERGDDDLTLTGYQLADAALAEADQTIRAMMAQYDELHDLWLNAEQGKTQAEASIVKMRADYYNTMSHACLQAELERRWTERTQP